MIITYVLYNKFPISYSTKQSTFPATFRKSIYETGQKACKPADLTCPLQRIY